jgi:hypothetical protein
MDSGMPDAREKAADLREIADLRERARRERFVAHRISEIEAAKALLRYAEQLETGADRLEAKYALPTAATVPSGEPAITEATAATKSELAPPPEKESAPFEKPEPEPAEIALTPTP